MPYAYVMPWSVNPLLWYSWYRQFPNLRPSNWCGCDLIPLLVVGTTHLLSVRRSQLPSAAPWHTFIDVFSFFGHLLYTCSLYSSLLFTIFSIFLSVITFMNSSLRNKYTNNFRLLFSIALIRFLSTP